MTWPSFLAQLDSHHQVTLVGPMRQPEASITDPTIYVDGGIKFKPPGDKQFSIHVGDQDSSAIAPDHLLSANKDFSDLAFVLAHLPASIVKLSMHGFLGGRRDHEILNFGETHSFLSGRPRPTRAAFWNEGRIQVLGFSAGMWTFDHTGLFSLVVFEDTPLNLKGHCEYDFGPKRNLKALSSLGLSNRANGELHLETEKPAFLFFES